MSLRNKIVGALAGASLLGGGITAVIQNNEGYSSTAYRDSAGVPTICYGETKGVQMGQKRSLSDCQKQLIQSAGEHAQALVGLPESLPDVVLLGSLDMAYNVGVSGFSNSAAKRKLKQGDYRAAGQAVLQWKYITLNGKKYDCSIKGNKVCYGLWKRRLWQSKAIGNEFKSVQEAVAALPK
jgi:GH24 family phage-related lysozyme (muramidase)